MKKYMTEYNPFNPNSIVVPNLFAGRTVQVNDICRKLSQLKHGMPASFIIYGERGIGKTALAKLIRYIATLKDQDFHNLNLLTSYYSVDASQDISSVLQESINKLTDQMDKNLVTEIGSRLGDIFKNGKFQIGAFGVNLGIEGSRDELTREITIKDQTVSILLNILRSIKKSNSENSFDGILIIIDELHNLKQLESAASILRNIVTTLDVENLGQVAFLLIGYEEDLDKFFARDTSARRTFDLVQLGLMPDKEAIEVLKKGFEAAGVTWDDNVLTNSIRITGGYPHAIQVIGHNLIKVDTDKYIDQKDWNGASVDTAFDLQTKEFSTMYSFNKTLTVRDKILGILAKDNKPLSRKEIANLLNIKNVHQYIIDLKKRGAVKEGEDKKLYLHSQLFRTAIFVDQVLRRIRGGAKSITPTPTSNEQI